MTQSQIDAAFNPEKEIVYGTPEQALGASWTERAEREIEVMRINEYLDNFNKGIDRLALGSFAIGASPFVIGGAAIYSGVISTFVSSNATANAMFGFSTKYWAAKASISTTIQAATNDGKVNLFASAMDGFFGYGSSAILGSGINAEIDITSGRFNLETLGNGIRADQYLFQVGTGFIFGAKGEMVTGGFNKAYGRGRPSNSRQITKMIYNSVVFSPATSLLNRAYDEKTK